MGTLHQEITESLPDDRFLQVSPSRGGTMSAPHSRSCSFKNRPRPKLELDLIRDPRPRTNSVPNCPVFLSLPDGIRRDPSRESINGLCRVRSFKTTAKGVINHGDILKKSSANSLMSTGSAVTEKKEEKQRTVSVASAESGGGVSGGSSIVPSYFRVVLLGSTGVGKTSLTRQFMTSESAGPYEVTTPDVEDEPQTIVSLLLDGEESMMEFIDGPQVSECEDLRLDAYIVVFSSTDHASFNAAINIVRTLRVEIGTDRAVILVANKTDLVRQRRVTSSDAKLIAVKYDCKYTEVSVVLNQHVDELVVGTLTQIRLKLNPQAGAAQQADKVKRKISSPKRAMSFISKLFKQNSKKAKSCDNLFVY